MIKRETLNKILLLHLLSLAESGIKGTTKLQKIIFVLEANHREYRPVFNYKFIRWHYGPYCSEIQKDIEYLKGKNYIGIIENGYRNEFYITEEGKRFLENGNEFLNHLQLDQFFLTVIDDFNSRPLEDVLREVYNQFRIVDDFEMGDTILPLLTDEEMSERIEGL